MRRRTMYVLFVIFFLLAIFILPSSVNAQVGAGTYDDINPAIQYVGSWTANSGVAYANAINGTTHISNDPINSYVSITFVGTYITYFYTMASNRGQFKVVIDNADRGTFNGCTPETRRQVGKTWYVGSNMGMSHVMKIYPRGGGACAGGWTDIDAFVVDIASYNPGDYDDASGAVRKVGTWTAGSLSGAYLGTASWSQTAGDLFRFTFAGSGVTLFYTREINRGKAVVTIDGVDKGWLEAGTFTPLDFYSSNTVWQAAKVWLGLSSSNSPIHVITITVTGLKHPDSLASYIDVDAMRVLSCPANPSECRAYSRAYKDFKTDYTGARADITSAYPSIVDTLCGLSSQVIWVGNTGTKTHTNYVEVGWRREGCNNGGYPYAYWQAYGPDPVNPVIGFGQLANITAGIHRYAIENRGDGYWYFLVDNVTQDRVPLVVASSRIKIGGEVTDYGIQHNELACVDHTPLQFKRNYGGWENWNGWDYSQADYAYNFASLSSNGFKTNGYGAGCGGS